MEDNEKTEQGQPADESFEQIVRRLHTIVERLEGGDLPLEESLAQFEQGVRLSRRGQAILDAAEQRVELLMDNGATAPLDPEAG